MVNRIEATKDYLIDVSERTIGWPISSESVGEQSFKILGILAPASSSIAKRGFLDLDKPFPILQLLATALPAALLLDTYITTALIDAAAPSTQLFVEGGNPLASIVHNPFDAVAFKLAANAATHLALDGMGAALNLAETAVNRIRNHRPSNITLAV